MDSSEGDLARSTMMTRKRELVNTVAAWLLFDPKKS
jgi:hypothetical protein